MTKKRSAIGLRNFRRLRKFLKTPPDPPTPSPPRTTRQQALDAQLKDGLKRLADIKAENAELKARHRKGLRTDALTPFPPRARGRNYLSLR